MSRDLVNASEAARRAGVPRKTVVTWIARERLFPVGLAADGTKLYDLQAVRALAEARAPRGSDGPHDTPTGTGGR